MDPALAAALTALRDAVRARRGQRLGSVFLQVQVSYADGHIELHQLAITSKPTPATSAAAEPVRLDLTKREKAVLAVLARAERPLKGVSIAKRARIRYNSHFRDVMSGLRERGLVILDAEHHYWPANRPLPQN